MPARDVAHAEIFEIDGMAVLLDQQDGAGDLAGHNLVAEIVADARQFGRRKAGRDGGRRFRATPRWPSGRERHKQQRQRRRDMATAPKTVSSPTPHRSSSSLPAGSSAAPRGSA